MRLLINDVKWAAFRVLIRFLYTGRIPLLFEPKLVFADGPPDGQETSWEEVFLAADRYEVDELRQLALATILSKLTVEGAIPFLFRTAYLHKDLRAPVVKYVATTCRAEISIKSVQQDEMPVATPSTPLDPVPTLADLMMERLYKDAATQDVQFVMGEDPFEAGSEINAPENEETLEEMPVDHDAKGSKTQNEVANEQESENKDKKDNSRLSDNNDDSKEGEGSDGKPVSDEVLHGSANSSQEQSQEKPKDGQASDDGSNDSKADEKKEKQKQQEKEEKEVEDPVQERIVGAHRMVLLHWPFFKKMIDSKCDDSSGTSELRIYISNVEWAAFRVLIRFLYTGRLPLHLEPKLVFADSPPEGRETSWEELFLAADRCEIDELRQLALTTILTKLTLEGTIPFLFRTAYLHEDLRAPVVKFVATTCGTEISKKSVQKEYENHDECI
ncbi:hypothetical protein BG000_006159 [Podila horticola]|nr:hypothetical protein BG000_006159 [Podila horticola]